MTDTDEQRRRCMGGMTAGAVAALASGSIAGAAEPNAATAGATALPQNPLEEYSNPPFPKQEQPWPGPAGRRQPPPDHGKRSYGGSDRNAVALPGDLRDERFCTKAGVSVLLASNEDTCATGQVFGATGGRGGP